MEGIVLSSAPVRLRLTRTALLFACLFAACSPTKGCVESNFELAPESRLPIWVPLPSGATRDDVSVALYYYTAPTADFFVTTSNGAKTTMSGRHWWHPRTKKEYDKHPDNGLLVEYPRYVVVEINGQIDVVEHRAYPEQNREPNRALFWMSDDPAVLEEARDSVKDADTLK